MRPRETHGRGASAACVLQHKLGARNAAAFDVNAACSGFLYALSELGRYDCLEKSLEALVLKPQYASLFGERERRLAEGRLLGWNATHGAPSMNTRRTGFSYAL